MPQLSLCFPLSALQWASGAERTAVRKGSGILERLLEE
jgi:hypothetical protein